MAKETVCKLNTTRSSRDRYYVAKGGQGNYGLPKHYPDHNYGLVAGIDRGNGYQEYTSITYALSNEKLSTQRGQGQFDLLSSPQWV